MSENRKRLIAPEDYKNFWVGIRGALLWGLIGIFVWLIFSAFGLLGSAAGAVLGIAFAYGYSKKGVVKPFAVVSLLLFGLIYIIISAYLGYVLNGYVAFIDAGIPFSEISLSAVLNYINDGIFSIAYVLYDVLFEIGIGLMAFSVLLGLTLYLLRKQKKDKEEEQKGEVK